MFACPFLHNAGSFHGQMPFENFAGVDGHKGFESLVFGMK
jgi:hypothetical protein